MTPKESQRHKIITELINNKINGPCAAQKLNLSVRQAKRLKARVIKEGVKGIVHKNRGKTSNRKLPDKQYKKITRIIERNYHDFTPAFTMEKLEKLHRITLSYGTVRNIMIAEHLYTPKTRKTNKGYHAQRPRKDHYGQLQQFDGSYHDWFEGRCTDKRLEDEQCLLLAVDDAKGEITHATLGKNESIEAVFLFWSDYIRELGKPGDIYLDKYSTYKINHKNATDNKDLLTQFQRAMQELDITIISAHSPQAKGRVERMNGTLQDRLVKEPRLQKINTVKEANLFIKNIFIPQFNKRFSIVPRKQGNVHRILSIQEKERLDHILCIKHQRIVRNDFIVQYKNRYLQLDEIQPATVYKKDTVMVEEHRDGVLFIVKKQHSLTFIELNEKPHKEISLQLSAITVRKSQYIPPANHPWKKFQFSKKRVQN